MSKVDTAQTTEANPQGDGGAYAGAQPWSGRPEMPSDYNAVQPPPDRGKPFALVIGVLILIAACVATGVMVVGSHKTTPVVDKSTPLAPTDTTTIPLPVNVMGLTPMGVQRTATNKSFTMSVPMTCTQPSDRMLHSDAIRTMPGSLIFACSEDDKGAVTVSEAPGTVNPKDFYSLQDVYFTVSKSDPLLEQVDPRITRIGGRPAAVMHAVFGDPGKRSYVSIGVVSYASRTFYIVTVDKKGGWISGDATVGSFVPKG